MMTRKESVERVREFLSAGFVFDQAKASAYVSSLGKHGSSHGRRPDDLLCSIVSENLGSPEMVAIPLTGGFDSRGLLGACLRSLETSKILCLTVGTVDYSDVVIAQNVCRSLGIRHIRIDPNELTWDFAEIENTATLRWKKFESTAPVDAIVMYEAIRRRIPDGVPVLSGFLGDAVSGKHLPTSSAGRNDPRHAAKVFLSQNTAILDPSFLLPDLIQFIEESRVESADRLGVTVFDLLDFGFRQRLRIKGAATDAFEHCITPYEDPRWTGYWLGCSVEDRLGQQKYRRVLQTSFPEVFRLVEPDRSFSIKRLLPSKLKRSLLRKFGGKSAAQMRSRGDPRKNQSMAETLGEAIHSFGLRGILSEMNLSDRFHRLMHHGDSQSFLDVRWGASAEILLRAIESESHVKQPVLSESEAHQG